MERTVALKKLLSINAGPTGIGSTQRTVHECTVCGTEFTTADSTCPQCNSQLFREKTTTPNAEFNLLFVIVLTGFAMAYNILSGQYPKGGPAA
jgi:DNA-directed RNA polymerase subunit RPC12/RpoP